MITSPIWPMPHGLQSKVAASQKRPFSADPLITSMRLENWPYGVPELSPETLVPIARG